MNAWIDVTVPLGAQLPVWPGDPPLRFERVASIERGDAANVTRIDLGAHTGTHVDAPLHFLRDGASLDALHGDTLIGEARVIAIRGPRAIGRAELEREGVGEGERILLRTANSDAPWFRRAFQSDFVHLRPDAAAYLAERHARCVGVDYLSVGAFHDPAENAAVHRTLLEAGVWIIEGLWLGEAEDGAYDLACLPMRLEGAEGAPARVMLRRRG